MAATEAQPIFWPRSESACIHPLLQGCFDCFLAVERKGPARALIDSLPVGRCVTGLLNGLASGIRIELSYLSAGPDAMMVGVVFAGWPSVAIVPTLLKSVGRDKPQDRVRKSISFGGCATGLVLAMHAGDEAV